MMEYYDESQVEPHGQTATAQPPPAQERKPKDRRYFKVKGRGQAKGHASQPAPESIAGKPWQQSLRPWVNLLSLLLFAAVVIVCLWNIAPYEVAVRAIASRFEGTALLDFLLWLPVIGAILGAIGGFMFWVIGAVVWACIQVIELMPMFMTNHPGYVRSVLNAQAATPKFRVQPDDDGLTRHLKKFYNRLPLRFLLLARRLRGVVYVIDLVIVMAVYPPCEGGLGRFFFLLGTGQWGKLDWTNIFLMFVTLFAVEAIVKVVLVVNHFRRYLKASQAQAATA